ncbi:MAG: hypothetical protein KU38_07695 [Sulfurovum sp. FS08-3]|nr:MAG: hypothetical protein KU38_07695 [Sulfurovum sp. FS08-3]
MTITIEDRVIELHQIKQLYPAAIVKTGFKEETTQVSLEWFEIESKGAVELVEFALFLELKDGRRDTFAYPDKERLFDAIKAISNQINATI